ncbi:hypothetical protein [Lysinibacillus fusiformis]|uniref:hypothetical protein n=1 Tax=Lysinibacillus fusiformis TaxID=28031 RepID=UPI000D3643DA|nr:hypothetical protein [Lysinibacillus fusiformis]MED4672363.1 hypothetical protein [Lysinibacillus fusiformis]RDV32240.1 hypothetical protein C7B90_10980 [Lysinibacillus fusiformis]GED65596.1 hypothetical protein LFU01_40480 [Lysinibacillus fusiformis]
MANIIQLLHERLTDESSWLLASLLLEKQFVPKERLWELTNEHYQKEKNNKDKKQLIKSRHYLDNFMYRLEGAALVDVQIIGQARLYKITELGEQVLKFKIKGE